MTASSLLGPSTSNRRVKTKTKVRKACRAWCLAGDPESGLWGPVCVSQRFKFSCRVSCACLGQRGPNFSQNKSSRRISISVQNFLGGGNFAGLLVDTAFVSWWGSAVLQCRTSLKKEKMLGFFFVAGCFVTMGWENCLCRSWNSEDNFSAFFFFFFCIPAKNICLLKG